jgi:TRAP-type C4-dicarboxylate transport system permease small subunit
VAKNLRSHDEAPSRAGSRSPGYAPIWTSRLKNKARPEVRLQARSAHWSANRVIGIPVVWLGAKYVEKELSRMKPLEPLSIALALGILLAAALVAVGIPALRAAAKTWRNTTPGIGSRKVCDLA